MFSLAQLEAQRAFTLEKRDALPIATFRPGAKPGGGCIETVEGGSQTPPSPMMLYGAQNNGCA
jgi:hypothetical protein